MKRVRKSLRVRTPSVPVMVITYLPTVVDRFVVTVRVEVDVEPAVRVAIVGLSVGLGPCLVTGSTEDARLMVPE